MNATNFSETLFHQSKNRTRIMPVRDDARRPLCKSVMQTNFVMPQPNGHESHPTIWRTIWAATACLDLRRFKKHKKPRRRVERRKREKKSRTCSAFPLPLLWLCTSNARPRISKLSRNLEAKLGEWNPRQPELILGTKSEHAAQWCGTIGFNVWKLLQNLQDGKRAGTGFFGGSPTTGL